MYRRKFLKSSVPVLFLLANGKIVQGASDYFLQGRRKSKIRFAVASDGHYGQKDTPYEDNYRKIIQHINEQHRQQSLDFCVINGDIIHNDPAFFTPAKALLDQLKMPYYVTQGNHDHVDAAEWEQIWGMPANHSFAIKEQAFMLASTSNKKGEYICPDLNWMQQKLEEYKSAENIFIFIHITPVKWTKHGIDCPEFINLLKEYKNVRAVFNGHDHDQDGVKVTGNIPFLFDSHIGGSWGTSYKGFRIVELGKDNTAATYILNPIDKINELNLSKPFSAK